MKAHHKHLLIGVALGGGLLAISGCATIVHLGGSEDVKVSSEPVGAKVIVDGAERGVTPIEVDLERKKTHTVVLSKDGYKDSTKQIQSQLSWWLAGNAIFGGLIGLVVDLLSGGGYTLDPSDVHVALESGDATTKNPIETRTITPGVSLQQ